MEESDGYVSGVYQDDGGGDSEYERQMREQDEILRELGEVIIFILYMT